MSYEIQGLTMAVTNMQPMLEFYEGVFGIKFTEQEMHSFKLYNSEWLGMKLLFCPAELAGNKAQQNRHQFDIVVSDIVQTTETVLMHHGMLMNDIVENNGEKTVGVYDPDQNSIVFKELAGDHQ